MKLPPSSLLLLGALASLLAACAGPAGPVTKREPEQIRPLDTARVERALARAERALPAAVRGKPEAVQDYQAAVAETVVTLANASAPKRWQPLETGRYRFDFGRDRKGLPEWGHWRWDEAEISADISLSRSVPPARGEGFGVPLTLTVNYSAELAQRYFALPQNGISLPATAVLDYETAQRGGKRAVRLRLLNPRETRHVRLGGRRLPLAWDCSAPVEAQLRDKFVLQLALLGLFNPGRYAQRTGIFALEPYRPDKIPVVFVHGLASDPHIWQAAVNAVLADEVLQRRYQLWYFIYPTGLPVPGSASRLREQLREANRRLNPTGRDPGMQRMVLIGHSMGGLLTRMQVSDSGDDYWNAYFRKGPEALLLTAKQRTTLVNALRFESVPWVQRAVFAATPHRGSKAADLGIVRFLLMFLRLPLNIAETGRRIITLQPEVVNPELWQFNTLGGASVQTLSPRHPYFRAMAGRPIRIPFHSIIGDRGRGDTPQSSDGVVGYASSHLDGARSEKIIPAPHTLTAHPQTVAEITRILHEHLRAGRGPARAKKAPPRPRAKLNAEPPR